MISNWFVVVSRRVSFGNKHDFRIGKLNTRANTWNSGGFIMSYLNCWMWHKPTNLSSAGKSSDAEGQQRFLLGSTWRSSFVGKIFTPNKNGLEIPLVNVYIIISFQSPLSSSVNQLFLWPFSRPLLVAKETAPFLIQMVSPSPGHWGSSRTWEWEEVRRGEVNIFSPRKRTKTCGGFHKRVDPKMNCLVGGNTHENGWFRRI